MSSWNMACIIQNIWAIISKAWSIWISWINEYVLKGRSFWLIPAMQNRSWSWRKILQLRPLASGFIERRNGVEVWKFPWERYSVATVWDEIRPRKAQVN